MVDSSNDIDKMMRESYDPVKREKEKKEKENRNIIKETRKVEIVSPEEK